MENMVLVKVEEAMKDQAFVEQLAAAETAEAAQAVFASRDIEFTLEEVKQIGVGLRTELGGDELSADDLDAVAGGVALATVAAVVKIIAGGVTIINFIGKRAGWWK